jgi:hypothetical protein
MPLDFNQYRCHDNLIETVSEPHKSMKNRILRDGHKIKLPFREISTIGAAALPTRYT